jgi:hypothetical protein
MTTIIFTPARHVEILKQKARTLKKEQGISHHEALEQIAKQFHYHHWHHVTEMAVITVPSEAAYRNGLLLAFDVKEADSLDDEVFTEASFGSFLCRDELWKIYLEMDEEDEAFHELPELEQQVYFEHFMNDLVFFRCDDINTPATIEEALKFINEHSFWMPSYVWFKGKLYDTYGLPATDPDGNVVGVRF